MSKGTVSIIIPTFNRGARLIATIDSALSQTFTDYEILVVNDPSDGMIGSVLLRVSTLVMRCGPSSSQVSVKCTL